MNVEVLPFSKLQPPKLYKNVQEPFVKQGNFFLQKFEKWQDFIFGPMLRQSRVWASRAFILNKSLVYFTFLS